MITKFKTVFHAARHFRHLFGGAICAVAVMLLFSTAQAQNLFVTSANNFEIYEFTNNAGVLSSKAFTFASLINPIPLAFDSKGDLFVGSAGGGGGNNLIYEFTNNAGTLSSNYVTFASATDPQGMAFDSKGDLFVSVSPNTILEFTNNTGTLSSSNVTFASGLHGNGGLAFDSAGDLFEADAQSGDINEFTNNAGTLSSNHGIFASNLISPAELAFDSKGDLFVTTIGTSTFGTGSIYEFTNNGVTLSSSAVTIGTGLSYPLGLVFDNAGNLFVANSAANTIVEYTNNAGILAGLVGLVVLLAVRVVQSLAKQKTARRTARDGHRIIVSQFAAESRAARAQTDISGGPGHGGAAREQAHNTGKWDELNE
jgi:hypothetical protein